MNYIFVDAENIGQKAVAGIEATPADKVLVFSRNEAVRNIAEQKQFVLASSYPTGQNQADFHIIATLVAVLASLPLTEVKKQSYILHSQDNALCTAFVFQCEYYGAKGTLALPPKTASNVIAINQSTSLENKILELLRSPMTASTIEKTLNLTRPEFTRTFNQLVKEARVERASTGKKTWQRVGR